MIPINTADSAGAPGILHTLAMLLAFYRFEVIGARLPCSAARRKWQAFIWSLGDIGILQVGMLNVRTKLSGVLTLKIYVKHRFCGSFSFLWRERSPHSTFMRFWVQQFLGCTTPAEKHSDAEISTSLGGIIAVYDKHANSMVV